MAQTVAERITAQPSHTARRGAGLQRFVAGWAALGVTLSGATQLRVEGVPLGPSEVILAAWILFVLFLLLRGIRFAGGRVFVSLAAFWLGALVLLGLGALVGVQTSRTEAWAAVHDGMAFVYMAAFTVLLALRLFEDGYRYHWHFARLTFLFHAVAVGLLLGAAVATVQLGPISLWYGGVRFRGWSENPNQMALAMAAMPFLGWWLMRTTSGPFRKAAYALGLALCVAAGIATLSDGLRVAWVASLGVIAGLLFYRMTMRGRSAWLFVSHAILPALVVTAAVFYGAELVAYLSEVAERLYAEGDQGEQRFTLWSHGVEAIAASPLVGFGPGSFSGYGGPFQDWEAHNSFIDWGMSTGLAGVLMYVGLLVWVAWRALRSRETALMGMWLAVVVVSIFGYVLRHPGFWTVMVLVLILSEVPVMARARHAGRPVPPRSPVRQPTPAWPPPLERVRTR